MIDFVHRDGSEGYVDCETFYEHMDNDDDDEDDEDCESERVETDCMEMVAPYVDGVESCTYWETIDCNGESSNCYAKVNVLGMDFEDECDALAEQFGIPMDDDEDDEDDEDDHDDECQVDCMEPFECHESQYEWCQMVECFDHCAEENVCFAEWNDHEGEFKSGTCDDYYHAAMCDMTRTDEEDMCDYTQCDEREGGDCWIEECNKESDCKKFTCTKWWYDDHRNYWTAEDCTPDEDQFDFDMFFHHAKNFISHYDDTFAMIAEHAFGDAFEDLEDDIDAFSPIDNNAEDIDEFLANDAAKYAASVVIEDTEEALNYLGLDVDLDWMHHALTAEDHEELKEMAEAFFGDDDYEGDCELYEEENSCLEILGDLVPNMTACDYVAKIDSCSFEFEECYTMVVVDGEEMQGDCWEIAETFGIDLDEVMDMDDDDEDEDECYSGEESGDCLELLSQFVDNMTECYFTGVMDCDDLVECSVNVTVNGESVEGDCYDVAAAYGVDLYEVLEDMVEDDDEDEDEDECVPTEEEGDCLELLGQYVEGMTYCNYYDVQTCDDNSTCSVSIVVNDVEVEGDCYEIAESFGLDLDEILDSQDEQEQTETEEGTETGEECSSVEEGSCLEDALTQIEGVTACDFVVTSDICTGDYTCYAVVEVDGETYEGECTEVQDQLGWVEPTEEDTTATDSSDAAVQAARQAGMRGRRNN